jgi:geranylgeranyl pyrophosphate synthase/predicted secreted hydrolase
MSRTPLREPAFDLPMIADPALPADWPGAGAIDLSVQDLPHASSTLEAWHLKCQVRTQSGRELSLVVAFVRESLGIEGPDGKMRYAHTVSWSLSDPHRERYSSKVAVDRNLPALGVLRLDAGHEAHELGFNRFLREVFLRGKVPSPTRLFAGEARVLQAALELDFGGDRLWKNADESYQVELSDEQNGLRVRLCFEPRKLAHRLGKEGSVRGIAGEMMFHYFIPRCEVGGEIVIDGARDAIRAGAGWYDHEFGFGSKAKSLLRPVPSPNDEQTAFRWLSMQLEGGVDVSTLIVTRGDKLIDNWTVVSDADGGHELFTGAVLRPLRNWRSTRSFVEYPVSFQLDIPGARMRLRIEASEDDQEVLSVLDNAGFWRGRVQVEGSLHSRAISGAGWVESKGFRFADIDGFFGSVSREVRERVSKLLPSHPEPEQLAEWLVRDLGVRQASSDRDEVDAQLLTRALITPIREIVDRGGKSWRSYAALACIDAVGGDSRKFLHWLPIPELLHVGSLLIDDAENASSTRRGGPSCHSRHGRWRAINAGTASYFLSEPPLAGDPLPAPDKLRIYGLYFDALRAGHAGQALDLSGVYDLALRAAADGITELLERHVLTIYRLRTAVPVAMMARIGGILGGGSPEQIEALGAFCEALGMAFQIMDDVRHARDFGQDQPQPDLQLNRKKVSLPVVKALARLPLSARTWLLYTICSRPADSVNAPRVVAVLEGVGAIDACITQARDYVDRSWARLDPLLEDSHYKIVFRTFAEHVLSRH